MHCICSLCLHIVSDVINLRLMKNFQVTILKSSFAYKYVVNSLLECARISSASSRWRSGNTVSDLAPHGSMLSTLGHCSKRTLLAHAQFIWVALGEGCGFPERLSFRRWWHVPCIRLTEIWNLCVFPCQSRKRQWISWRKAKKCRKCVKRFDGTFLNWQKVRVSIRACSRPTSTNSWLQRSARRRREVSAGVARRPRTTGASTASASYTRRTWTASGKSSWPHPTTGPWASPSTMCTRSRCSTSSTTLTSGYPTEEGIASSGCCSPNTRTLANKPSSSTWHCASTVDSTRGELSCGPTVRD